MSDSSVENALRSDAPLVVVEAPAGCGKTTKGADYAREVALTNVLTRVLIVTHTHAACSVFADRTKGVGHRVEIRTIDSLISQVACAYHSGLGLPRDIGVWVRQQKEGYTQLALKVSALLLRYPMIAASIAQRYPVVICDEHQDSSGDQHSIVMALRAHGSRVRIFGDPMQKIFKERATVASCPPCKWDQLAIEAHTFDQLDFPHRWASGSPELGRWTLSARAALKNGGRIDLRNGLPPTVTVIRVENESRKHFEYQLSPSGRRPVDLAESRHTNLLILTRYNQTARSIRAFFNRRIPLWEGHAREGLETLVDTVASAQGDCSMVAAAVVQFMGDVAKGFSPSGFGDRLQDEVAEGCKRNCRGKTARIQELARLILDQPNHIGVSKTLLRLSELSTTDRSFSDIKIDHRCEFWEAARLGDFENAVEGLAEITHRRAYSRPKPPQRAVSTIHKAKGLECDTVMVMPCDAENFPNREDARCLLYVALSRAKCRLVLVVPPNCPSPLLSI